ncbi:MAG: nitronate monooxygenase [Deltaproteobacteria bacterium]|nr:nitronate monooxygenase [Deltaproteobacteria bacterium]MBN2674222.1 nitronate monooxygenase [Deltaproteobacteria bacterium]
MISINRIPKIIQGGMGAGISNWKLAKTVSMKGGLGIVAGTALDQILVRRLQNGDTDGHMRRALEAFPAPASARRVLEKWFQPHGNPNRRYRILSKPVCTMNDARVETMIVAAFVEMFLAKEGHDNPVGFNCLEKMQLPLIPSIFGAMLAGVDCLTIGAGFPVYIPKVLDNLLSMNPSFIPLHVEGRNIPRHELEFDPHRYIPDKYRSSLLSKLQRPLFFPIISSPLAGKMMLRKNAHLVDGFIVENHRAGGHNAPPRTKTSDRPSYGKKDDIDMGAIAALGKPFWLAGGYASPEKMREALRQGASGVQIGSLFAYSAQSGLDATQKKECLDLFVKNKIVVKTDFAASPTGYPFKTILKSGTATDPHASLTQERKCDLGYLRTISCDDEGKLVYNCPATNADSNALCVCNGLMSAAGLPQMRTETREPPLLTCGEDYAAIAELASVAGEYTAEDALNFIRGTLHKRLSA